MKKSAITFACFLTLLVTVSAFVDKRSEASIGIEAPTLVVGENQSNPVTLESLKGQWVVLSFWSADDAPSRIKTAMLDRYIRTINEHTQPANVAISANQESNISDSRPSHTPSVVHMAVNFDSSEALMREVAANDGLSPTLLLHESGATSQQAMRRAFAMSNGLRSFLIDPEGRLVAADPSADTLRHILKGENSEEYKNRAA